VDRSICIKPLDVNYYTLCIPYPYSRPPFRSIGKDNHDMPHTFPSSWFRGQKRYCRILPTTSSNQIKRPSTSDFDIYLNDPIEKKRIATMSYLIRSSYTRVPRAIVQTRTYAEKTMSEQVGDAMKKVGQAFKVSSSSVCLPWLDILRVGLSCHGLLMLMSECLERR